MFTEAAVCLALNMYHEARGEGVVGMVAVGQVAINRVADPRWPGDICKVIKQGGARSLFNCQFSWYCDGKVDKPSDIKMWTSAMELAEAMLVGAISNPSLKEATCYHATWVEKKPAWTRNSKFISIYKDHVFYKC